MSSSNIMDREALQTRTNNPIPNVPLIAIRGHACFRCWKPSEKLTKCSGCRRVYYCSKSCQKLDWGLQHKKHCKIFRHINAIEEKEAIRTQSWKRYRRSLWHKLKYIQGVSRDGLPVDTIQGQPYCSTCYRSLIEVATTNASLKSCDTCRMVFSCSDCSCEPSHTEQQCLEYRSRNALAALQIKHFESYGSFLTPAPMEHPRTKYMPLSGASDWVDYLANISDKPFLRVFMGKQLSLVNLHEWAFSDIGLAKPESEAKLELIFHFIATDSLTIPVSIVAALEATQQGQKCLMTKETVLVHVIGAAGKEFANLATFEEILHLLPNLRHLKVVLVGPRNDHADRKIHEEFQSTCCPECSRLGRTRTVALYHGLYHGYAKTSQYRQPDIAVLFHSGRTQEAQASWRPTTEFLVNSGTLTLCTSYNNTEATQEAAELDTLRAKFIVRPEVNKWKSLIPLPDFNDGPEHGVFYHNWYRYVFQGTITTHDKPCSIVPCPRRD